jgi:PAS domain S-box-containing protein
MDERSRISQELPMSEPQTTGLSPSGGRAADSTERQRLVDTLQHSEELHRRILDSVPAGIVAIAADGSFLQANEEALRSIGLSWEELSRRCVSDFEGQTIWEDGSPCRTADYPAMRCLQSGRPQPPATIGAIRRDGTILWGIYSASPIHDQLTGQPVGAVLTFLDITERKRAELALQESEERFRRFFKAAFEGIVIHQAGRILDANDSYAGMFGYALSELIGKNILELTAPESRAVVRSRALGGHEEPYEAIGLRKDGSTFPGEFHGKMSTSEGQLVRVTAVRDLTERKRADEQLRDYAARLQALSRRVIEVQEQERRYFARELHDEIGQYLTGLKLTLETCNRLPPQGRDELLAEAQALVRELTGRVRDLSMRLRPAVLDDLGLLPALLWQLKRYTTQTGVHVVFEHGGLDRRFPSEVETAAFRVVQEALTNVARHAEVREATVRLWVDRNTLGIQVEDHGVGFDVDSAVRGGQSSGLSGMQDRVALLGGHFSIEASPGAGTRILAHLPALGQEWD